MISKLLDEPYWDEFENLIMGILSTQKNQVFHHNQNLSKKDLTIRFISCLLEKTINDLRKVPYRDFEDATYDLFGEEGRQHTQTPILTVISYIKNDMSHLGSKEIKDLFFNYYYHAYFFNRTSIAPKTTISNKKFGENQENLLKEHKDLFYRENNIHSLLIKVIEAEKVAISETPKDKISGWKDVYGRSRS